MPYLPDFLADGIALRFVGSGTAAGWTHTEILPLTGTWPDIDTWRLVLADGVAPAVTVADRTVTATLSRRSRRVRSSSTIDASTLDLLGLWDWIADTVAPAAVPDVLAGQIMVTPAEVITLVHATQLAAAPPDSGQPAGIARLWRHAHPLPRDPEQSVGDHEPTRRRGAVARMVRRPRVGNGTSPGFRQNGTRIRSSVPAGADGIELTPAAGGTATADPHHEFGDTIHRLVSYTPHATTRFREYLPPPLESDPTQLGVIGSTRTIHVPCSVRPGAPHVHSVMPTFTWDALLAGSLCGPGCHSTPAEWPASAARPSVVFIRRGRDAGCRGLRTGRPVRQKRSSAPTHHRVG